MRVFRGAYVLAVRDRADDGMRDIGRCRRKRGVEIAYVLRDGLIGCIRRIIAVSIIAIAIAIAAISAMVVMTVMFREMTTSGERSDIARDGMAAPREGADIRPHNSAETAAAVA